MDTPSKGKALSRIEELRRKRAERNKNRRKPERNFMAKIDEITKPHMGDESAQKETISLKLDTYSLKEYFRHKKVNQVVKKNQSVQTEKFLEESIHSNPQVGKTREISSSVADKRANKTLMNVLGTFARRNSIKVKDDGLGGGNFGKLSRISLLSNKSANPFAALGKSQKLMQTSEIVGQEDHSQDNSFYSQDEDNMSVMSEEAFGKTKKRRKFRIKELSPEKALKVIKSQAFKEYFMESSRYLEKVLNVRRGNRFKQNKIINSPIEAELKLSPTPETKDWFVGDLQWNPFLPSVFLTTYFNKEDEDPSQFKTYKDILHIWNVNFTKRPEKELISYSKIQTAKFHPLANETIVVGFESGMVGLFDLRSSKEPVLKSKVTNEGHKSTVTCIDMMGSKNSNFLISASEDGRVCQWDINKLETPVTFFDLGRKQASSQKEESNFHSQIEPMSISHNPGESDMVYIGGIDSQIHQLSTQKLGLAHEKHACLKESYSGHRGPVNLICHNKMENHPNFQGLMLSGSFDWTIKLWNPKVDNSCRINFAYHSDELTGLSFNSLNPFMFASCDSSGLLCLNTLYGDVDEPMFKYNIEGPLFNAEWDNTGRILALTDDTGSIHLKRFRPDFFDFSNDKLKGLERIVKK